MFNTPCMCLNIVIGVKKNQTSPKWICSWVLARQLSCLPPLTWSICLEISALLHFKFIPKLNDHIAYEIQCALQSYLEGCAAAWKQHNKKKSTLNKNGKLTQGVEYVCCSWPQVCSIYCACCDSRAKKSRPCLDRLIWGRWFCIVQDSAL
jgi:hypothetical protein